MGHWRSLRRGDISSAGQGVGLAHALAKAAAKLLGLKPVHARHLPPLGPGGRKPILGVLRGSGAVPTAELPLGKNPALMTVVSGDGDPHQLEL